MAKKKSVPSVESYPKPRMFVGCASEKGKAIAKKFISALEGEDIVTPIGWWDATEFQPMHSTLDGLLQAVDRFDFGLFILTPDDLTKSRGKKELTIRDNVLFELGMFLGRLGPKRAFAVVQSAGAQAGDPVKTPSDLLGIHIPRFKEQQAPEEQMKEVKKALKQIISAIETEGFKPPGLRPLKDYDIDRKDKSFVMTVSADIINANLEFLKGGRLAVVAYRRSNVYYLCETEITVGHPREIIDRERDDIVASAPLKPLGDIRKNDDIDAHLLFIPRYVSEVGAATLLDMKRRGCHLIGGGGIVATAGLKV